ncbi:hypothetical protein AJ88_33935 [Mesorhizobium amorphae CCBAU 01583]|nr:hypothetical protein AJ88_33935 [Mesorhizobium amorphae CCBAU 01583]
MIALARKPHRAVILTTANALLQRIPPADLVEAQTFHAKPGNQIDMNALVSRLETSGFERVPTVRGVGEFAVRGGILDLFAPGWTEALRLDFFGDTLESIRVFDAATQRTTGQRKSMALQAMSEVALTPKPSAVSAAPISRPLERRSAMTGFMRRSAKGDVSPAWNIGCRCSMSGWRRCSTICPISPSSSTIWRMRRWPNGIR